MLRRRDRQTNQLIRRQRHRTVRVHRARRQARARRDTGDRVLRDRFRAIRVANSGRDVDRNRTVFSTRRRAAHRANVHDRNHCDRRCGRICTTFIGNDGKVQRWRAAIVSRRRHRQSRQIIGRRIGNGPRTISVQRTNTKGRTYWDTCNRNSIDSFLTVHPIRAIHRRHNKANMYGTVFSALARTCNHDAWLITHRNHSNCDITRGGCGISHIAQRIRRGRNHTQVNRAVKVGRRRDGQACQIRHWIQRPSTVTVIGTRRQRRARRHTGDRH